MQINNLYVQKLKINGESNSIGERTIWVKFKVLEGESDIITSLNSEHDINTPSFRLLVDKNNLVVETNRSMPVKVFTMTGVVLGESYFGTRHSFFVQNGIYVIRVVSEVKKVLVRN